jgi:hypothetical protein
MSLLKTTFSQAAFGHPGSDTFWLLIWALFILDEADRREERRRKRRREAAQPQRRPPPPGPRPW